MAWFKKKADPISDRARALNAEIAALEEKIRKLDSQLQQNPSQPRLRSTAVPHGATIQHVSEPVPHPTCSPAVHEPIFESVDQNRLKAHGEAATTSEHYNELGVRKYDLPALLQRIRNLFRGPSTTNPKLVNYLAAGGIQGLRPMRYEKRVARNRFIVLVAFIFLMLLGFIVVFVRHH
jgi:hypothetical protein